MKFVIVLFTFVAASYAGTNVQRCTGNPGHLPRITLIEGCHIPPCELPLLSNVEIHMSFEAPRNMQYMRTLATAYLGNFPIPYNLGAMADTCNFLTNARCPVNRGQLIDYTLSMFIESVFPVGTTTAGEFQIVDQNNVPVVCVRVPIRFVPPRNIIDA